MTACIYRFTIDQFLVLTAYDSARVETYTSTLVLKTTYPPAVFYSDQSTLVHRTALKQPTPALS